MLNDKDKVFSRAKSWAYNNGLRGGMECMDFGVPVQAYMAGYRAALRDSANGLESHKQIKNKRDF